MYLSADEISTSETIVFLGMLFGLLFLVGAGMASWLEYRKQKITQLQTEEMRQLVRRYEQLAEHTMDAQQRAATDLSEVRTRTEAIETLLRSVG